MQRIDRALNFAASRAADVTLFRFTLFGILRNLSTGGNGGGGSLHPGDGIVTSFREVGGCDGRICSPVRANWNDRPAGIGR